MFSFDEKVFVDERQIKYVFQEASVNSDYLIVIFSSFNSPNAKVQHSYNYMRTLEKFDCNKLYILDDHGPRGCYYLGENLDYLVEKSVIKLIDNIAKYCKITRNEIISTGSSKGGSAALYYGAKYKFGHVIAGAPQTKIADYILAVTKETAEFMIGDISNLNRVNELNSLIFNLFDKTVESKIKILTSENDWQFKFHIKPLMEKATLNNIDIDFHINNDMENHSAIALCFPKYLINQLLDITCGMNISGWEINDNKHMIFTNLLIDQKKDVLFEESHFKYIVKSNKKIVYEVKSINKNFNFIPDHPSAYQIEVEIHNQNGKVYELTLGDYIFGKEYFKLKDAMIAITDGQLHFEMDIETYTTLDFAFYILKGNEVVEKVWYQKNSSLKYKITSPGIYKVTYFILTSDGQKIISNSESVEFKNF